MMGGTGVALTEPIGLVLSNPASYVGLYRPSLEIGLTARTTSFSSSSGNAKRNDAGIAGLGVGVPFGHGKWGMALGLVPYSDVGYTINDSRTYDLGQVNYAYTGTGGVDRVFAGVARVLYQGRSTDKGGTASRLTMGANFDFLFGSIEQTRTAEYPLNSGFNDTRAFSALVLRAPTYDIGLQFSSQLISKQKVAVGVDRRRKAYEARLKAWKDQHPDQDAPFHAPRVQQAMPWRFTLGATVMPLTRMNATYDQLISTYTTTSTDVQTVRDTVSYDPGTAGHLDLPMELGFGVSVHNDRWCFTAEAHRRDWAALALNVEGYSLPSPLRAANTFALGARFQPNVEGGLFGRSIYRFGLRQSDDYREVLGSNMTATAVTLGLSLPINSAQTNSFIHIGFEAGQRGTTANGLIQERYLLFRVGLSITPWKGERWFVPYRIQ